MELISYPLWVDLWPEWPWLEEWGMPVDAPAVESPDSPVAWGGSVLVQHRILSEISNQTTGTTTPKKMDALDTPLCHAAAKFLLKLLVTHTGSDWSNDVPFLCYFWCQLSRTWLFFLSAKQGISVFLQVYGEWVPIWNLFEHGDSMTLKQSVIYVCFPFPIWIFWMQSQNWNWPFQTLDANQKSKQPNE